MQFKWYSIKYKNDKKLSISNQVKYLFFLLRTKFLMSTFQLNKDYIMFLNLQDLNKFVSMIFKLYGNVI